jgi:hypothetical protein
MVMAQQALCPEHSPTSDHCSRIPDKVSPKLLTPTEPLIQALALALDGLVVCGLLCTHCDHRHASMGTQMLSDDRCLYSSCGRALYLQEG